MIYVKYIFPYYIKYTRKIPMHSFSLWLYKYVHRHIYVYIFDEMYA